MIHHFHSHFHFYFHIFIIAPSLHKFINHLFTCILFLVLLIFLIELSKNSCVSLAFICCLWSWKLPSSALISDSAGLRWSLILIYPTHPTGKVSKWSNTAWLSKAKVINLMCWSHFNKVMNLFTVMNFHHHDEFSSEW